MVGGGEGDAEVQILGSTAIGGHAGMGDALEGLVEGAVAGAAGGESRRLFFIPHSFMVYEPFFQIGACCHINVCKTLEFRNEKHVRVKESLWVFVVT